MRRLLMTLATATAAGLVLVNAFVGGASASPAGSHTVYSHHWQGITFVGGLDSCPVFGAGTGPFYVFRDVDLTDHINSTQTPIPPDNFFVQFDSVGSVEGVINAPDGTYQVAGGGIKEHRSGSPDPPYFSGSGHLVISGPGGTVVGEGVFQDLTTFGPPELDLLFSSVKACHLN